MTNFSLQTSEVEDGALNLGESSDLHESVTLLSFHNDELGNNPTITSLADRNILYLAIDKNLWIISSVATGMIDYTHTFSYSIEAFQPSGDLLLVGLANGDVHLINTISKESIATCSVMENIWFGSKFFVGIYQEAKHSSDFIVLITKGQLYKIAFNTEEQQIKAELLVDFAHNIMAVAYSNGQLVAAGNDLFSYNVFLNVVEYTNLRELNIELKQLWFSSSSTCIGLKADGTLCGICPQHLMISDIDSTDEQIHECMIYVYSKKCYMFFVTEVPSLIKMVEFDGVALDGEEVFNLKIDNFEQLIFTDGQNENQMYLTRGSDSVRVHTIRNSKPTDRLQQLIRKGLYEDAEAFAVKYNLSRLDLDQAMVSNYAEKVTCSDEDILEMMKLMRNIPDVHFKVHKCKDVITTCESIESVERIFDFIAKLHYQDRALEQKLNSTLCRFVTYKMLSRSDCVSTCASGWKHFYRCDLFKHLLGLLRRGDLELAIIVFPRLNVEDYTLENIAAVLGYLENYFLSEYAAFLNTMIPITVQNVPEALGAIIESIIDKVYALEGRAREMEFPEGGIAFVEKMLKIITGDTALGSKLPTKEEEVEALVLVEDLLSLWKCLATVLELKNNYDIHLSLKECVAGPGSVLRALLGLNIKCVENFLKNFLVKFMLLNGIDADEVLSNEIRELMKCNSKNWASHVSQVWRCISATETKLELLRLILQTSPKPWCADIRQMLTEALEYRHHLVAELQFEARNEQKYVVLFRSEYGLRNETLYSIEKNTFVIQRIIYCNLPTMVEDIYTLCTNRKCKGWANFLLLQHFIETNDATKVFGQINSFTPEQVKEYFFDLCSMYESVDILQNTVLRRLLIETLDFMALKLSCTIPDTTNLQSKIDIFKIINVLPEEMLNMDVLRKLYSQGGVKEVLQLVMDALATDAEDFERVLAQCRRYSEVFHLASEKILLDICVIARDSTFLHKTATEVYARSEDVDTLSLTTVLILRSVGMEQDDMYGTFFNDTIQNGETGKPVDEKQLQECLVLGLQIIAKAYLLSNGDRKVSSVFSWMLNAVQLKCAAAKHNVGHFALCGTTSSMRTMSMSHSVFNMYCEYLQKSSNNTSVEYLTYQFPARVSNDSADDDDDGGMSKESFCRQVMRRMEKAAPSIMRENHHWTLQHILLTLQGELLLFTQPELNKLVQEALRIFKSKLVTRVFAEEKIDTHLAFSLLLSYERRKALKIVNEAVNLYKMNFPKFESIVWLGKRLTTFYNSTDHYHHSMLGIKWRHALTACSFSLKEFFSLVTKNELLNPLIARNEITLKQITSFCADFQLDAEPYYLVYLNKVISTWKPEYEVDVDSLGNRTLAVRSKEEDLTAQCLAIVELIQNRDAVLKSVDMLWSSLNCYYYEAFATILSIAARLKDSRHMNYRLVLQFLKNYQRTEKPCQFEREEWYARFPSLPIVDAISAFRFPFSPVLFTADLWKILRYEIALSNYEKWFELAGLLKYLNRNEICSYVIKQVTFVDEERNAATGGAYYLQSKFKDVLIAMDKCLAHITDPVLAASMAFHLMHKPPAGADRVIISKLAYKYANLCRSAGIDNPNYPQIEKLYFTQASSHILHLHNLAIDTYLDLCRCPDELINALYRDDRILKPLNNCLSQCPNINGAADDLGKLYNIDMGAKRRELLNSWLSDPNSLVGDADQSIFLSPDAGDAGTQNSECVIRAAYLCSNDDIVFWRNHLYQISLNSEQYLVQARAFKTMCIITSPEELSVLYDCTYNDILQTTNRFFVLHDLHSLGFTLNLEQFGATDKKRLIHRLGKHIGDPLNLRVMMSIGDIYGIIDLDIWEKIIQGMICLNMVNELKKCIILLLKRNLMLSNAVYFKAYQIVVDSSFIALAEAIPNDLDAVLIDLMHFIQCSPVLTQLDLTKGIEVCKRLQKYSFAMLLLQYVPSAVQDKCLKDLLHSCDKRKLLRSMEKFKELGFVGLKYVVELIEDSV